MHVCTRQPGTQCAAACSTIHRRATSVIPRDSCLALDLICLSYMRADRCVQGAVVQHTDATGSRPLFLGPWFDICMRSLRTKVRDLVHGSTYRKSVLHHPRSTMRAVRTPEVQSTYSTGLCTGYGAYLSTSKDRNANKILMHME